MSLQPMQDYFRDCVKIEARESDRMRASVTFPSDLQGPPEAGHGGGVAAMLLELVRLFWEECAGRLGVPRPVQIAAVLHRELPLMTPLRAEVVAATGAWHSRIARGEVVVAEAEVRPAVESPTAVPSEVRREWEASHGSAHEVPGYEFCLACGLRNPRGVQMRFDYNARLVWKQLTPQAHFRCADGSVFSGFLCIVGDEIGWWLGALRQGECGLSNRVAVCLGDPVPHGVPLLVLGDRAAVATTDRKGRIWQSQATIVTPDWHPVASIEVQFAGSPAFTKVMLPRFVPSNDSAALQRVFPRHASQG